MTGLVLLRARAHRLLLAAALLTVLLTTSVLTALTAYSGAIGDAALRHSLSEPDNAAAAALVVKASAPASERAAADATVRAGARRTFDGLPVAIRTLVRSGPYALPRKLQSPSARSSDPDLTQLAVLDRGQVRITTGRAPAPPAGAAAPGREVEAALPVSAADRLGVRPGTRLTLTDRLRGPSVRVRITGLYRPAQPSSPYWQLDDLGGRGVHKVDFTTYGPLLVDAKVFTGTVAVAQVAWIGTADFSSVTTGRIDALREASLGGPERLRGEAVSGTTAVRTSLPEVLDRVERSLFVSRSTLLIVALQLILLAGYALLLVARLLSAERAGESRLLRARGGSRARVAGLAALEALLLAAPAAVCAPLLAAPLTRVLAGQGALSRIGLRLDAPTAGGPVLIVSVAVALGCALAVTVPALTANDERAGRPRAVPAPLRAGADIGLLVIAAVAYWQLGRQDGALSGALSPATGSTTGSATADGTGAGSLGVDPLLAVAPALALLAGTVLTLRLLPPVARLAERRAAAGRGIALALAGWQFSRRPMRGAGPVLLLVLAVAMGMLAVAQGASWNRSQDDQADFRAGAPIRVLGDGADVPAQSEALATLRGVREVAPAFRTGLPLSGSRTATVLALDTAQARDALLLRKDLADEPADRLLARIGAKAPTPLAAGAQVPGGTSKLRLTLRILATPRSELTADVAVTLEDRFGIPYLFQVGELPADGRPHDLTLDLTSTAGAPAVRDSGPLALTALQLDLPLPVDRAERHRLVFEELRADDERVPLPRRWQALSRSSDTSAPPESPNRPTRPRVESATADSLTVGYGTGFVIAYDGYAQPHSLTLRVRAARPKVPEVTAVATGRFLSSSGARPGQRVDVTFGGMDVPVRIVDEVRALPTTGAEVGDPNANVSAGSGAQSAGPDTDGGGLLVDLRTVNRVLTARYGVGVTPTEWWLRTQPGHADDVVAALRARPDVDRAQVVVRDEIADRLRDDPFGAGPEAAFAAAAIVAAVLAAVGFAVGTVGSLGERAAEFAVLRALGTPRRRLVRMIAAEQGVLVGLALLVGVALGTVLARAVIPLVVLTSRATRPEPEVLVELPLARVAPLLVAVAVVPLLITAVLSLRRVDTTVSLRAPGGE
ncbi:ABC transporter permease [Streptomyces cavernae]|uniref:ABC transporter permease n=1 Tax=Streptomyces cavernae TaxID=2259034 RepID=UPI000FEBF51A|nr:ABC transporter permease [Streptomyces cavernae]